MRFEWDAAKNDINLVKHGVDFPYALRVFAGSPLTAADARHSSADEARFITVGEIDGRVFLVVWTSRGDATRLISARRANAKETQQYRAR